MGRKHEGQSGVVINLRVEEDMDLQPVSNSIIRVCMRNIKGSRPPIPLAQIRNKALCRIASKHLHCLCMCPERRGRRSRMRKRLRDAAGCFLISHRTPHGSPASISHRCRPNSLPSWRADIRSISLISFISTITCMRVCDGGCLVPRGMRKAVEGEDEGAPRRYFALQQILSLLEDVNSGASLKMHIKYANSNRRCLWQSLWAVRSCILFLESTMWQSNGREGLMMEVGQYRRSSRGPSTILNAYCGLLIRTAESQLFVQLQEVSSFSFAVVAILRQNFCCRPFNCWYLVYQTQRAAERRSNGPHHLLRRWMWTHIQKLIHISSATNDAMAERRMLTARRSQSSSEESCAAIPNSHLNT